MPIGSGNFGKLLDGVMRVEYGLEYAMHPEMYTNIYDVRNSSKAYEEVLSLSGFGAVGEKGKGTSVSYDDAKQNWLGRHQHVTYGKGFIVERELYDDDQTNIIKSLPKALARSVRHTIEYIGADQLNNATSTAAAYVNADGKALSSLLHPLGKTGGTFQNRPTNYSDLDSTSLEQALIDIGDWTDDAGLNIMAKPKKLILPTELDWQASKLMTSALVPEDANNATNPAKGLMPYSVNNYLTDADAWFLITDIPNGMVFYWRRRPDFSMDNDFDTENAKWKTVFRCIAGHDNPRGIYVNTGG